jgi:hypothetical protein
MRFPLPCKQAQNAIDGWPLEGLRKAHLPIIVGRERNRIADRGGLNCGDGVASAAKD